MNNITIQDEDLQYNPPKRTFCFYQITAFPFEGKHAVRKVTYDQNNNIVSVKNKKIGAERIKKFTETTPHYKFNLYPVYELDMIAYPDDGEVLTAQSLILNNMP